jgi:Flp pilus assembly CpaF family ATPase
MRRHGLAKLVTALAAFVTTEDRGVLIEDTAERPFEAPDLVRFELLRNRKAGLLPITIRDLLRARLRHRLDRVLVGESTSRV